LDDVLWLVYNAMEIFFQEKRVFNFWFILFLKESSTK